MPGPYPLATLAPTIDANGIATVLFEDSFASLQAWMRNLYGSDIWIEPDSQDGQWLGVLAQAYFDLGQAIATCYFSFSPAFAQGVGLSNMVKINGLRRQTPTHSSVELLLVGQANTPIANGAAVDGLGQIWDLPASVTIPPAGQILVWAQAREAGRLLAPAGTITMIQTLMPGWQSVTNPTDAQPGVAVESDAQLRRRQYRSTAMPSITPVGGIYGTLAQVTGVGRIEVWENDKDWRDANGIPGHSIACVVEGGNPNDIAWAIAVKKSPACGTFGSTCVDVLDGAAQHNTICFFFVNEVEISVQVSITPRLGYVTTTADLIRQAVAYFISQTRIGWPVFHAWLFAPADLAGEAAVEATGFDQPTLARLSQTYVVNSILLGTSPASLGTANITTRFYQSAIANPENIAIRTLAAIPI